MNFLVLNITHHHKLYNFFDTIKNRLAFKENIELYNLYNDTELKFIPQLNDVFYKNDSSNEIQNLNPADCNVKHVHEMFKKFYYFCKVNIELINRYDFIVRCNSSTFVNFKKIKELVNTLPTSNCYAGYKLNDVLVSGACNIFSKDIIARIVNTDIEEIPYRDNYDDVAIGNLLAGRYGIPPLHIDRYDLSNNIIPHSDEIAHALNYYTVRVRNNINREHFDVQIWNMLFTSYVRNCLLQQN